MKFERKIEVGKRPFSATIHSQMGSPITFIRTPTTPIIPHAEVVIQVVNMNTDPGDLAGIFESA